MKVECQQCGSAFAVADAKVAGRSLKLRCKKCGGAIPVDGTSLAVGTAPVSQQTPTLVPAAPTDDSIDQAEPVWHIAVDDATQGPYTLEELATYYAEGSVEATTMVFCDGWHDWRPAGEVAQLQQLVRQLAPPRSVPPAPPKAVYAIQNGAGRSIQPTMGRDPFADSGTASPRVNVEDMHVPGKTHEATVQFSLDQIRALSSVSAPSMPPVAPIAALGYASGDGSGLIDMRTIAAAETGFSAFTPIIAGDLSPLSSTMAPLSLPVAGRHEGLDGRTKVFAGLAAFGFLVAGGVAVLALTRSPQPAAMAAPMVTTAAIVAPQVPEPVVQPVAVAVVAEPALVAPGVEAQDDEADSDRASDTRRKGSRRSSGKRSAGSTGSGESKSSRSALDDVLASADKAPVKKSGGNSIDDLLDGALSGKRSAPKPEAAPEKESSLPMAPGRDQMLSSLGKAKAKAAKCKGSGVATAAITIAGKSGRVSNVSVSGVDGSAKSCVEKAVRSTSFPKFQKESFDVKFPFKLGG